MGKRPRFLGGAALTLSRVATRLGRRLGWYGSRDKTYSVRHLTVRRIFSTFRINCVLDVGAHHGDFAAQLRMEGYTGLIISFEPVSANFRVLQERSASDPRWRVHQMALGSRRGSAEMRVFGSSTFHSLLDASEYGRERFPGSLELERTEAAPIEELQHILDGLVADIAEPHIFLKVDTQGYDLEVIRGLGPAAARIDALQMELTTRPLYEHSTNSVPTALAELAELGFRLSAVIPILYEPDGVTLVEFDCLMCRSAES